MFSFAIFSSFKFIMFGVLVMLINASSHRTLESPGETWAPSSKLRRSWSVLRDGAGKFGLPLRSNNSQVCLFFRVVLLCLCHRKSPENSAETEKSAHVNARTLSHSGGQVIILGQMCPPAVMPSQAGRPTSKREHMPALPSAAGPDMCYFLLAQPTCAAEPFSCTEMNADLLQQDED